MTQSCSFKSTIPNNVLVFIDSTYAHTCVWGCPHVPQAGF